MGLQGSTGIDRAVAEARRQHYKEVRAVRRARRWNTYVLPFIELAGRILAPFSRR